MNKLPPVFDPYTCLHQTNGYSLFVCAGKPWVVRKYSKRTKMPDGTFRSESFVEHLTFDQEWPQNATAVEAKRDLEVAWNDWRAWQEANGGKV